MHERAGRRRQSPQATSQMVLQCREGLWPGTGGGARCRGAQTRDPAPRSTVAELRGGWLARGTRSFKEIQPLPKLPQPPPRH